MSRPGHRKRMKRREFAGQARYLTFSCYRRMPLLQNDSIKQVFVDRLDAVRRERPFCLWAWVIMPEHVHLLILPELPDHPVDTVLASLKRPVAERVISRWRDLDAPVLDRVTTPSGRTRFWQPGGGYDRNVVSDHELYEKIDYIHANPIRRGLVDSAEDWPWSSARWYTHGNGLIDMDPIE